MQELHEEHPSIVAMKNIARSYLWWPYLDAEIELMVKNNCEACQSVQKAPPKTQHPCTRGDCLLKCEREYSSILLRRMVTISFGLVDSHSKWIEVAHMTSTSAKSTIDQLRV